MRRAKKSSGASLDSLLDTMTNVVGILVILLTVTQLGVGDAVKRIADSDSVKPEVLESAKVSLAERLKLWNDLVRRLKALVVDNKEDAAKELERLKKEIAKKDTDLADVREKKQGMLALKKHFEEVKKLIEEHEKKEKELLTKINSGEAELASLKARLAETPNLGPPQAKIVYLPNPREAPKGSKPLTFLCREGRVMFVDVEAYQQRAQKRAMYLVSRRKLYGGPQKGVDGKRLVEEFNKEKLHEDDFDLTLTVSGRTPRLVLKRRKDAGDTADQLRRTSSKFQQRIRRTDPKKYYLQFQVWPDSFETYLEARKIASERGLLAGWVGTTTSGEYTVNLGGEIRCGPPPPKPPPRKPGDPPPPKRPPRPVVRDVID